VITPVVELSEAQAEGKVPPTKENVGAGAPVVTILKLPATPAKKVAVGALVMAGA
jgi:hypothetical protein